ncbi:MAG: hypothetical protein J2P57_07700, partial [Acidimicrobiaceae bacterium]|nr:hypothetical protein [Acidimicrobiaceae bacterium]
MFRHSSYATPRRLRRLAGAAVVTTAAAAGGLFAAAAPAAHAQPVGAGQAAAQTYTFRTIDNQADPTFNQLLGINTSNVISGYFGSGQAGHPNKGYVVKSPYAQANFTAENFPGSGQTQVTGLNNKNDTVGFWVKNGIQRDFVEWNGSFTSYHDPNTPNVAGSVNQLLGINDAGIAVGFYVDANGVAHPVKLNQATGHFTTIRRAAIGKNSFATGINDHGDITGFTMNNSGTYGWLIKGNNVTTFQFPGSLPTTPLGINQNDEIVGSFVDNAGNTHGFTLVDPTGPVSHWQQINDPNALNTPGNGTVVNGLNNAGDLVGFYTDA